MQHSCVADSRGIGDIMVQVRKSPTGTLFCAVVSLWATAGVMLALYTPTADLHNCRTAHLRTTPAMTRRPPAAYTRTPPPSEYSTRSSGAIQQERALTRPLKSPAPTPPSTTAASKAGPVGLVVGVTPDLIHSCSLHWARTASQARRMTMCICGLGRLASIQAITPTRVRPRPTFTDSLASRSAGSTSGQASPGS